MTNPAQPGCRKSDPGRIHVIADDADLGAAGLRGQVVQWRPDRRRLRRLPPDFALSLAIARRPNGIRQIVPHGPLYHFLLAAAVGGLAIGTSQGRFTREERQSHRLMLLLFQWSNSDRRMAKRTIRRAEDLVLRRSERGLTDESDILPEIWLPAAHETSKRERLSPAGLLASGLQAAQAHGLENPSVPQQIDFGLFTAALQVPAAELPAAPEPERGWLRIGLFGIEQPHHPVGDAERALIETRLVTAVQRHLDANAESFRNWLWRDVDNLIQQVSQRGTGGRTSRPAVRAVLQDLLWQSYNVVSECVRLQMQAIRNALTPPLSGEELTIFRQWYDRQPWLSDYLPVMLHHRLGLLLPALDELEREGTDPNRIWAALVQAIQWSSEMTERRRRADRDQKRDLRLDRSPSDEDLGIPHDDDGD